MNEICAHILKPTLNLSIFPALALVKRSNQRLRRSLDIIDEDPNGNYSDQTDELDYEILTSTTQASIPEESVDDEVMAILKNATDMIKAYLDENLEAFRHSSETNAMTALASFGLFFNFLSLLAIILDRRTALTSRRVHGSYVVAQQVFLVFVICFLNQKKDHYYARYRDLEAFNYFTVCLGLVQFLQPWMLLAVAGYVRGRLENLFDIGKAPSFPVAPVVTSLLFAGSLFSTYIPPVRVQLHHTVAHYNLCGAPPVEKLWNLDKEKDGDKSMEFVNVLIYNLSYIFAIYLMPSILIAYQSKGIVDLLHALQEQPKVLANCQELACTSLVISVTCNLHLACVTIKVVVYMFYLVELFIEFVGDAFVFFQYLSVFGNLLIVTGTGCHVFVLMRYNWTVQYFLFRVAYQLKFNIYRLRDSLPKWKKTNPKESDPADTDAASHV